MLSCLKIENIAVIKEAELETGSGFNVLTGETGAGKSIIIDAIYAVMGRRTSKELIRTGHNTAQVSALFSDVNEAVLKQCDEYGIEVEDKDLLLQRRMSADGKNICRINGQPVTLSVLREISENLVNIHGQHDNQQLLNSKSHCGFIDAYAENDAEREEYLNVFYRLKDIKKQLKELYALNTDKLQRTDMLTFAVQELEAAQISVGEIEQLKDKRNQARNSEKLTKAFRSAVSALKGDENTGGVVSAVDTVSSEISKLSEFFADGKEIGEKLIGMSYELQAVADYLNALVDSVQFSAAELEQIEDRIDLLSRLSKKYGATEQDMLDYLESAKAELTTITTADEQIAKLEAESQEVEQQLVQAGKKLTQSRTDAGNRFANSICDVLKYLQMPNVRFLVDCKQGTYTKNGCDEIEFLISANLGENPKPLAKIASGGEMSRIMLAIKSVLLTADNIDTLIFDEIDSGISGNAAGKVGNKLKELSVAKQVICITHLAQIAALADNHFLITKAEKDNNTFTSVQRLEGDERIAEIARIMSGSEMTENLYKTAKELLEKDV